jgi:hypothetical protein
VDEGEEALVHQVLEMRQDALGLELLHGVFRARLRIYPWQTKRALVNDAFISDINHS